MKLQLAALIRNNVRQQKWGNLRILPKGWRRKGLWTRPLRWSSRWLPVTWLTAFINGCLAWTAGGWVASSWRRFIVGRYRINIANLRDLTLSHKLLSKRFVLHFSRGPMPRGFWSFYAPNLCSILCLGHLITIFRWYQRSKSVYPHKKAK